MQTQGRRNMKVQGTFFQKKVESSRALNANAAWKTLCTEREKSAGKTKLFLSPRMLVVRVCVARPRMKSDVMRSARKLQRRLPIWPQWSQHHYRHHRSAPPYLLWQLNWYGDSHWSTAHAHTQTHTKHTHTHGAILTALANCAGAFPAGPLEAARQRVWWQRDDTAVVILYTGNV